MTAKKAKKLTITDSQFLVNAIIALLVEINAGKAEWKLEMEDGSVWLVTAVHKRPTRRKTP